MSTPTQHAPARRAPARPTTGRASWTEYQRLLTAGVNPTTAAILATGQPHPDDERAYWRQLAHRTPTTPETRAAHAAAQRQRRRALRTTPSELGSLLKTNYPWRNGMHRVLAPMTGWPATPDGGLCNG
jgi:hypothetical protein